VAVVIMGNKRVRTSRNIRRGRRHAVELVKKCSVPLCPSKEENIQRHTLEQKSN